MTLKADLADLREIEPKLQQRHSQARRRLEAERSRKEELLCRHDAEGDELQALRREVKVLGEQKAALMQMVQQVYGTAKGSPSVES